jgi:hypothetical protein
VWLVRLPYYADIERMAFTYRRSNGFIVDNNWALALCVKSPIFGTVTTSFAVASACGPACSRGERPMSSDIERQVTRAPGVFDGDATSSGSPVGRE